MAKKQSIEQFLGLTVGLMQMFSLIRLAERYFSDDRIEETARRNRIWNGAPYRPVRKGDELRAMIQMAKVLSSG